MAVNLSKNALKMIQKVERREENMRSLELEILKLLSTFSPDSEKQALDLFDKFFAHVRYLHSGPTKKLFYATPKKFGKDDLDRRLILELRKKYLGALIGHLDVFATTNVLNDHLIEFSKEQVCHNSKHGNHVAQFDRNFLVEIVRDRSFLPSFSIFSMLSAPVPSLLSSLLKNRDPEKENELKQPISLFDLGKEVSPALQYFLSNGFSWIHLLLPSPRNLKRAWGTTPLLGSTLHHFLRKLELRFIRPLTSTLRHLGRAKMCLFI